MNKKTTLIIGIIIGVIVSTVVGVTATVLYNSSEIGFTPSNNNWHVNNLQDAINDLYTTANPSATVTKFTGAITVSGYQGTNHVSYVDIDTTNYNNLKLEVSYIDEANVICNIEENGNVIQSVTGEGTYNVDVSSFSKVRIYYRQVVGYDHMTGTYELSN